MKIIKEGDENYRPVYWWEDQILTCACGCICKTESDDLLNIHNERRPNGKQTAFFKCPTCNNTLTLVRTKKDETIS